MCLNLKPEKLTKTKKNRTYLNKYRLKYIFFQIQRVSQFLINFQRIFMTLNELRITKCRVQDKMHII